MYVFTILLACCLIKCGRFMWPVGFKNEVKAEPQAIADGEAGAYINV